PVSGTLERIALEEGDRITKGDVVAQVELFTLEQQIKGMEALIEQARTQITGVDVAKPKSEDLDGAEVRVRQMRDNLSIAQKERAIVDINYAEAEREFNRVKALFDEGAVSQSSFDEAQRLYKSLGQGREQARLAEDAARKALQAAELSSKRIHGSVDDNEYMRDAFEAEIENLEAQLGILKNDLEKSRVRAPVDSILLEKYIDDRRVLMAGTPVMKLGDVNTIEIESDVLSEEVGRINVGDAVELSGKAVQGATVMGQVKRIYPSGFMKISALGVEQQRVKVIIAFDNSDLELR
ncbi:MAG: HlyD family efflux transporter periplasmic adaptor subunit, partial [bacterium]|nr:HlyD family efflux transporter periplasmic adaptor subunit [bacterium]